MADAEELERTLGRNVRALRVARSLTQAELATQGERLPRGVEAPGAGGRRHGWHPGEGAASPRRRAVDRHAGSGPPRPSTRSTCWPPRSARRPSRRARRGFGTRDEPPVELPSRPRRRGPGLGADGGRRRARSRERLVRLRLHARVGGGGGGAGALAHAAAGRAVRIPGALPCHLLRAPGPAGGRPPGRLRQRPRRRLHGRAGSRASDITPLDRLAYAADRAMGALEFRPPARARGRGPADRRGAGRPRPGGAADRRRSLRQRRDGQGGS